MLRCHILPQRTKRQIADWTSVLRPTQLDIVVGTLGFCSEGYRRKCL